MSPLPSSGDVVAPLHYLKAAPSPGVRPFSYATEPPPGTPWESHAYEVRDVEVRDARIGAPASLDSEGFTLCDAPTGVSDFMDMQTVRSVHYPEVAQLVRRASGGTQVHVFDHLVRRRAPNREPLDFGRRTPDGRAAANGRVHNDYTELSGRRRRGLVLGDAEGTVAGRRFAIFNVWRSISGPVLDTPLAVCDARTVEPDDLVESEVRYARRIGEIYLPIWSARHRWSYFSRMDIHEALIFKQFDSQPEGAARHVPHAAFDHPLAPADAPLRESIEVRCLVIF